LTDGFWTSIFGFTIGAKLRHDAAAGAVAMNTAEIVQVINRLADGIDPISGQPLPRENLCNHPYVIRALFAAVNLLQRPGPLERPIKVGRPAPAKAGSAWTSAEDKQLMAEMAAGTKLMEIAKAHDRSRGAILARTVRLGLFESRDDARAAMELGLRQPTNWEVLKKERPQAGKVWTDDEDQRLISLFDEGVAAEEIGKHLGRGTFAVQVRLHKLGKVGEPLERLNTI
jgi:hypothetical protein